ncbi:50S ribosomal protein L11 methyltransferase [Clostridium sp. SM-530-WT-3G]|uniref:50S ribosomal protein L11 methyltransferase n=1 Tax=Clostridium sp. SM-530-WT-3G TaxID=2725303 RepID=UPI00145D0ED3|nr:50S ribosomal protein L11 methyltransferase [Clostridium sp. SM-530-WT-3G]NME81631.1 methyltransferase domain-containing protein [Clostridium sp. SM-530-WT-3G]
MIQISFPIKHSEVDEVIDKLISIGLDSTYYDAPYDVTIDSNGYGFIEREDEIVELKIFPQEETIEECDYHLNNIKELLNIEDEIKIINLDIDNWQMPFEPVDLNNGYVIAEPNYDISYEKGKINFESQGSFGTGLHETTQDLLRYILNEDFTNLKVLDLGTGSGILSIAAAIKNAEHVTALDIRDVTEEVTHNFKLNKLNNIEVLIKDVTKEKINFNNIYDVVFINIGGDETISSMELINNAIKPNGILYVSGLVEWSSEDIYNKIKEYGYNLVKKTQTNEWVTMILKKNN